MSWILRTRVSKLQTQSSSIVQRVQFLESRGLTGAEIYQALAMAYHQKHGGPPEMHNGSSQGYVMPGMSQPWDWRDYFVSTNQD
jgi:peroxin-14